MDVQVKQVDGYFSVYVDNRLFIDRESFSIAYGIAHYLMRPDCANGSELSEVAEQIRKVVSR